MSVINFRKGFAGRAAAIVLAAGLLAGCGITETFQRGYVVPEHALEQIPLGASQEQVLIVLGTPSTVATPSSSSSSRSCATWASP